MFKWFRKYNKFLLVVGGCFLMVAFLIPTAFSGGGGRSANNPAIGHIGGDQEVFIDQQRQSAYDLELLRSVFGSVHPWLGQVIESDPHKWLLMKLDADRLGISAGDPEVAQLLAALKIDPEEPLDDFVARLTAQYDITEAYLYVVVTDWLRVEKYKEIQRGQTHTPVRDRLLNYVDLFNRMSQAIEQAPPYMRQMYMSFFFEQMIRVDQSEPRVSVPLLERFAADAAAQVTIAAVPVSHDLYISRVEAPSEDTLTDLFEKHKGDLPGASDPYGFGYKYPHRAKLEYLSLPLKRVTDTITIEEADAVRYYDDNLAEFTSTPEAPKPAEGEETDADAAPPTPVTKPYKDVRTTIIQRLRRQAAQQKAEQIIRAAQSILLDDASELDTRDGFRVATEEWSPLSLDEVAKRIQKRFSILPDVTRIDDVWSDRAALASLDGIGTAAVPDRRGATFADYALAAREFEPQDTNPLASLRLQVNMPSLPLSGIDGSQYLFRVIDASPAHEPASIDEVRDAVVQDARKLAAYKLLLEDRANWAKRLNAETLEQLAESLEVKIVTTQPFSRRRTNQLGILDVPDIVGIGRDVAFVDAVYEIADAITATEKPLADIPLADRSAPVASDRKLTLYLVRIDDYKPLTPSQLKQQLDDTSAGLFVQTSLLGPDSADPLSVESISKRLKYVPIKDDEDAAM